MDDKYYLDMIEAGLVEEGLAGLVGLYQNDLVRFARSEFAYRRISAKAADEAEDVVQNVWLNFRQYAIKEARREIGDIKNFLIGSVRNEIFHLAKNRRHEDLFENDIPDDTDIDVRLIRQAEKLDAQKMLGDIDLIRLLSPCQRVAYMLRWGFALPPRFIERIMGVRTNVISSSISQASARIAKHISTLDYQLQVHEMRHEGELYQAEILINNKVPIELSRIHTNIERAYFILPVAPPFKLGDLYYLICHKKRGFANHTLYKLYVDERELQFELPREVDFYAEMMKDSDDFDDFDYHVNTQGLSEEPDNLYERSAGAWWLDGYLHENNKTGRMVISSALGYKMPVTKKMQDLSQLLKRL